MKKWLYAAVVFAALCLLTRLPHPAKDIADLEPVRVVYLFRQGATLRIETDTGAWGSGEDLAQALEAMRSGADGEIFLETAEFLLLSPQVPVTEDFYTLLRPGCGVVYTDQKPDLTAAARYLTVHPPKTKLRDLRADAAAREGSRP